MNTNLLQADELTRRQFLSGAARAFLGVGASWAIGGRDLIAASGAPGLAPRAKPAAKAIYLYMAGGMSHLDTFNPRPDADAEIRGPVSSIKTSADGVRVSEYLPRLAKHMHRAAVINSLHSTQGAHDQGQYFVRTSYQKRGTIQHPHLGAWHLKFAGRLNETLPGFVTVNSGSRGVGAGFFDSSFEPLAIRSPEAGLQNIEHYSSIGAEDFDRRLKLASDLDYDFRNRYEHRGVKAYGAMYEDAVRLMKSSDLKAFDLSEESQATRAAYGEDRFGQGCLLARRLIEHDVRFVEVQLGGWDTHTENFERVPEQAEKLDQGMSALLDDLAGRGLLDDTLVILATEFGRTPRVNQNDGRDHYPKAFSAVLAGGGVQGGTVFGATDRNGTEVVEDGMEVEDFNATVAYGLGLPLDQTLYSPSRRPFTVAHKGSPVTQLFS